MAPRWSVRAMADTCADWNELLVQARLGVKPAELHGSVTGFPCAAWSGVLDCMRRGVGHLHGSMSPAGER